MNEWSGHHRNRGTAAQSVLHGHETPCLPAPRQGLTVKVQLWENNRSPLQGRSRSIGPRQRGGLIVGTLLLSRQSSFQCMMREA